MKNAIYILSLLAGVVCVSGSCTKSSGHNYKEQADNPVFPASVPLFITQQNADDVAKNKVILLDAVTGEEKWSWSAADASDIKESIRTRFKLPTECKPVYQGTCVLIACSSRGVALVRLKDKKVLFYTEVGTVSDTTTSKNPHSAEIMPDGNIAIACSSGNCIMFYKFNPSNPYVESPFFTMTVNQAHNIVWDYEGNCFWYAYDNKIAKGTYKNNGGEIEIKTVKEISTNTSATGPHDMFPVYGKRQLYISYPASLFKFDVATETFHQQFAEAESSVKSISDGPELCVIQVSNGTDDSVKGWCSGNIRTFPDGYYLQRNTSYDIYKSRQNVENTFSYGPSGQKYPF